MALPGVRLNVTDGNLGLVETAPDKPIVIGPALGAVPGIYTYSQPKQVVDELLRGTAVTCASHILDVADGSVDVLVTAASVAGVIGSVTQIGTGPAVTAAVTALDATYAVQIDDPAGTPVYVDKTDAFASSTAADVNPFPATEAIGDQFAIGFTAPFNSISITISTAGTVGTLAWKFWNGTAWTTVSGLTDGTTGLTAVPGTYTVTFTMPTTWQTKSINGSGPLYFLVAEVATTYTIDPVLSQGRINNIGPHELCDVVVTCELGGALGTGTYSYSLDGGETSSATRILPSGGTFDVPDTGITLTFNAGTYVAGTTYSFPTTPRTFNSADLDAARTAMLAVNTRWKFAVYAGVASAADAATLASAVIGHMDDLADDFRLMRALMYAGTGTDAAVNAAFVAVEDLRLALFHSTERVTVANPIEGWRKPFLPTVYNAAAMAAAFTRGTNIGWVGAGAPPNGGRKPRVTEITFDEFKEGEQLHDKKINATRTFVGKTGFYFVNGLLKCPAGSDFRYLHWGLAFDLACETAVDAVLPYTNANLQILTDGSGKIRPEVAAKINKQVNAALRAAVLEPLTEQGTPGFFSDVEYKVDETYNILANSKFRGDLRCVPLANTEQAEINAGLTTSIGDAEAA